MTANLTVQTGTDPSPSSHLAGTPFLVSSTVAVQRISGLTAGVTYILQMVAITAFGDTLSLYSRIPARAVY